MNPLTLPQARIPLGWATVSGQRVPVEIDIEWMRAFLALVGRTGGTVGTDFSALIAELAAAPVSAERVPSADPLPPAFEPAIAQDALTPAAVHMAVDVPQDARIESLQAAVHRLQNQINDIQQGYQV